MKSRRLDRIRADSDFAYDWNGATGGAALSLGFDSDHFADVDINAALTGLQKIDVARNAGSEKRALDFARLKSFSLVVKDDEMLDALYELAALESGGSPKEIRAAAPTLLRAVSLRMRAENPRTAAIAGAVADFLEKGGRLAIRAEPEEPVPLSALQGAAAGAPDALIAALNLTVERRD
jgi:hypothetical protein